jgi:hypothetical protein
VPGIESTPDKIGETVAIATGIGIGAHLISTVVRRWAKKEPASAPPPSETQPPAGEKGQG